MMNKETLLITPEEAQIISNSIKESNPDLGFLRPLLLRIGWCLLNQKPREIEVDEPSLWFLRDKIDPNSQAGEVTGWDLLLKIYKLLIELNPKVSSFKTDLSELTPRDFLDSDKRFQDQSFEVKNGNTNQSTNQSATTNQTKP